MFGYTVLPGDMDMRGMQVPTGSFSQGLSGPGTIKAKGTDVDANRMYERLAPQGDHKVDTAPPTVEGLTLTSQPVNDGAYGEGEVIRVEVAFSEDVTATGLPYVELEIGSVARRAVLQPTADTAFSRSFSFDYEVQASDTDADGLSIAANALRLGGVVSTTAPATPPIGPTPRFLANANHKVVVLVAP